MENELSKLEELNKIPTELLTEVTSKEMESISKHTEIDDIFDPQPQTGNNTFFNQNADKTSQTRPQGQPMNAGSLISSKMAMQLFNILIPTLVATGIRTFLKKDVNKKQLEATASEMNIIEPVLSNYLNSVSFNVESPLNALIITVAMVYGTKVIEVINNTPTSTRPKIIQENDLGFTKDGKPRTSRRGMNATGRPRKIK